MAERFTADLLFIIIVLLIAALLGFLIGYYLEKGRCKKKCDILDEEIASLKAKIHKLEEEKLTLLSDVRRMDDEIATLKLTIEKLEKEARLLAEQAARRELPHS